jgi:predicted XRE-type DNA-binding protein
MGSISPSAPNHPRINAGSRRVTVLRRYDYYRISTDTVFRDLDLPDAEDLNIKAGLAIELGKLIRRRGFTQTQAAAALGIDQPVYPPCCEGISKGSLQRSFLGACER